MRRPIRDGKQSDAPRESSSKPPQGISGSNHSAASKDGQDHVGKSVLVVDDETAIRGMVKSALERAGLRVLEAQDGIEALQVLDTQKPDLLLSDIVMPRMDGVRLAIEVAQRAPDVPILLMSGFTSEPGPAAHAKDFLRKPFAAGALVATVIRHLRRSN
jgi:DNA-binding response OmpR family regulator